MRYQCGEHKGECAVQQWVGMNVGACRATLRQHQRGAVEHRQEAGTSFGCQREFAATTHCKSAAEESLCTKAALLVQRPFETIEASVDALRSFNKRSQTPPSTARKWSSTIDYMLIISLKFSASTWSTTMV